MDEIEILRSENDGLREYIGLQAEVISRLQAESNAWKAIADKGWTLLRNLRRGIHERAQSQYNAGNAYAGKVLWRLYKSVEEQEKQYEAARQECLV